jgi:P-loop containing NTP hydrolase pore-1
MLSSCSACLLPPADYPLWDSIGDSIVKHGLLSQLQLEGVMYASMKHLQWLPSGQRASIGCVTANALSYCQDVVPCNGINGSA